nr:hypothetical protein BaRGS_032594 [Batillaria attramentaria]
MLLVVEVGAAHITIAPEAAVLVMGVPVAVHAAVGEDKHTFQTEDEKVKDELQKMESKGIIEHVTKPTDWCSPIVPVMKNGTVRICADLKKLNAAVKRERYMLPTLEDLLHKLSGSLRKREIQFLGHLISKDGVLRDPSKVEAIKNMPDPTNVTELRRLLGMINFLGRYIPNLSTLLRPVTELLERDRAWSWGPAQSQQTHSPEVLKDPKEKLTEKTSYWSRTSSYT